MSHLTLEDVHVACRCIVEECAKPDRTFLLPYVLHQEITKSVPWVLEEAEFLVGKIIHSVRQAMRMGVSATSFTYYDEDDALKSIGFDDAVLDVIGDMGYTVEIEYGENIEEQDHRHHHVNRVAYNRKLRISWNNPLP